jgi:ABC-type nitrate/sulfonate/bicarbonate transport system substrate-binding protein
MVSFLFLIHIIMKKSLLVLLGLTSILLAGCGSFSQYPPAAISETPTLRVGWMTTRATAGQAIEALKHTDILERNNITAEFPSFLFGPPLNEAAMARQLDFTIVGDMPVVSLLSNSEEWSVVARSIYFPFGLMVRSDLSVTSIADLQGKIVGVPFGSGPQPNTYQWLQEAGLIIGETVQVINLPIDEMAEALTAKRVDAVMTREPTMTTLESK